MATTTRTFQVHLDGEWHDVPKSEGTPYCGAQCDGCGQAEGMRIDRFQDEWSLVCDECGDRVIGR